MNSLSDLRALAPFLWELPKSLRKDMRVAARVYIDEAGLRAILDDKSLEQLINVATLPGIEEPALAMPDIHQGYGFPVGGVAAIRTEDGVISPGGIGYDINCGVRLLTTPFNFSDLKSQINALARQIQRDVPSGVGRSGGYKLDKHEMNEVLESGMHWACRRGYADRSDMARTEENGFYRAAAACCVSDEAKSRGMDQLGTLGSGNHFLEIQKVTSIDDKQIAAAFGLSAEQVCIMIHTGSRGLGHQTCTDYVRLMNKNIGSFGIALPDRELACAPFHSTAGQEYFKAMAAAANFAWVNRQLITHQIRKAFQRVLKTPEAQQLALLYDVSHNIAKLEKYNGRECIVHRKGATRSFGPLSDVLPPEYRETGQPVIIPGSMGTSSYVLAGTETSVKSAFGSSCHGAGRALSRMRAKKTLDYGRLIHDLESRGIEVCAGSAQGLLEEAPQAYKNVEQVVGVVAQGGLARVVAKLAPLAVIKG